MKHFLPLYLLLLVASLAKAATTDTIRVFSQAMQRNIPVVVVLPDKRDTPCPTIYLLHGHSNSYNNGWINQPKGITRYADQYQIAMVMPDGGYNSWYFDSPIEPTYRYETFIVRELTAYIESHYPVLAYKEARAITGNSMGGHGALFLAFRHPDVYGAAGSTSGGVDLCPFPNNWEIAQRLGSYQQYPERWKSHSVINLTELIAINPPALIFDCGSEDFFYGPNCRLHAKLLAEKIPHEFISRPGEHNWTYWQIAIESQMMFFDRFFRHAASTLHS